MGSNPEMPPWLRWSERPICNRQSAVQLCPGAGKTDKCTMPDYHGARYMAQV